MEMTTEEARFLYKLVLRLEILQGLRDPPPEWGITDDRVVKIMEVTGEDFDTVRTALITGFGEYLTDEGWM